MSETVTLGACLVLLALTAEASNAATSEEPPERDVRVLFARAEAEGRVGSASKTEPIEARPAKPGEVVTTLIMGEGVETKSKPAAEGDWVVRNRCPAAGNEEYLVKSKVFVERYAGPFTEPDQEGWQEFHPMGLPMRFFIVSEREATFRFVARWGEPMSARPGDAIVQNPNNLADTYRVAAASFECTYEILLPTQVGK